MISLIAFLLLIIGLFFPSSLNTVISTQLVFINMCIFLSVITFLIIKRQKINKMGFFIFIGINLLLILSTYFTPFNEIRAGSFILYLSLSVVFMLDLSNLNISKNVDKLFFIINIVIFIFSFAITSEIPGFSDFLIKNYSAAYPELVPNMMMLHKPVFTFGTHSLAGFFMFLLFFICFEKFKYLNNKAYLIFSILYMVTMIMIGSVTSYLFFGLALCFVLWHFTRKRRILLYFTILIALVSFFVFQDFLIAFYNQMAFDMRASFGSTGNGFFGRYSSTGNLQGNFNYLKENYFRPVGFGYSPEIMYVDSGYVEYLTRGTFLLVILIFAGLFLFLRNNLKSKNAAYSLFFIFLLFENGFSGLTYYRTIYLLPFIVLYLNHIYDMHPNPGLCENKKGYSKK